MTYFRAPEKFPEKPCFWSCFWDPQVPLSSQGIFKFGAFPPYLLFWNKKNNKYLTLPGSIITMWCRIYVSEVEFPVPRRLGHLSCSVQVGLPYLSLNTTKMVFFFSSKEIISIIMYRMRLGFKNCKENESIIAYFSEWLGEICPSYLCNQVP